MRLYCRYYLYTRAKVASNATVDELLRVGASLGLDNSVLIDVEQEGCTYPGFNPA